MNLVFFFFPRLHFKCSHFCIFPFLTFKECFLHTDLYRKHVLSVIPNCASEAPGEASCEEGPGQLCTASRSHPESPHAQACSAANSPAEGLQLSKPWFPALCVAARVLPSQGAEGSRSCLPRPGQGPARTGPAVRVTREGPRKARSATREAMVLLPHPPSEPSRRGAGDAGTPARGSRPR